MKTGCGDLYVTINEDEHGLFEAFAQMGKAGGCSASQNETTGRLISLAFRSGIDINSIIKQLSGIRCPSPFWYNGSQILSCSDAIAKALKLYIEESGRPEIKGAAPDEQPAKHDRDLPRLRRGDVPRERLRDVYGVRVLEVLNHPKKQAFSGAPIREGKEGQEKGPDPTRRGGIYAARCWKTFQDGHDVSCPYGI